MAASTIFYTSINSAKEFMRIIIDIDTKLTNISKVMSEDMSISKTLDDATTSAERFGQSISQALDAYTEFARQGYKAEDLSILSNAGLVAANVGELTAQQASEFMTASMTQWQMETKEAMSVIDSWNAISNNYATTVVKMAEGQSKAGATARAMNLDFDQTNALIGMLTASMKQSGSEIGNFLKNTLARLTSDKAMSTLNDLNVSLTDQQGNLRDVVDVYTDVANAMKSMSEVEQIQVVESLSGKYHIARMQQLLNDLGSADSMYRNMLKTSQTSEGSALQENEKYMQSLQARINLARVEVEKLALALGDAFVTDGMISFLKVAGDVLRLLTSVTENIGFLPVAFGTASVGALMLSSRFRNFADNLIDSIGTIDKSEVATRRLSMSTENLNRVKKQTTATVPFTTATIQSNSRALQSNTVITNAATVATNVFKVAMRSLLLASGVGIALAGVGFVIEKIASVMGDARQKAEELESANKLMLESYKSNAKEIDSLSSKYQELNQKINDNKDSISDGEWSEYYDVQNKLGELIPDLVAGEDQYGNKLIISAEAVRIKTDLLREQLEIEKQLEAAKSRTEIDDNIDTYNSSISDASDKVEDYLKMLTNGLSGIGSRSLSTEFKIDFKDSNGKPILKSLNDLDVMIQKVKSKIGEAESKNKSSDVDILKSQLSQMERYYGMLQDEQLELTNNISKLKTEYIKSTTLMIAGNKELSDSAKETASTISSQLINITDPSNVGNIGTALESIFDSSIMKDFVNESMSEFDKLDEATYETFESITMDIETFINNLPNILKGFVSEDEIKAIQDAFSKMLNASKADFNSISNEMKSSGKTLADTKNALLSTGESMDDASKSAYELKDMIEQLAGVSKVQVDDTEKLLQLYEHLTIRMNGYTQAQIENLKVKGNLTSEEQVLVDVLRQRNKVMNDLDAIYPNLLSKDGKSIELSEEKIKAIELEQHVSKVLLKAYEQLRDGKLNAEQKMTLGTAENTKARIAIILEEMKTLERLIKMAEQGMQNPVGEFGPLPGKPHYDMWSKEYADLEKELGSLNDILDGVISNIDKFSTEIEKSEKKTKNSTKTTKESIYITDKYKQSIEELSLAIEKQQKLQNDFPTHSASYRKAIEAEIKLQKEKLNLMDAQAAALDKQIKSGKIAQTGNVTIGDGVSKSSTGSSKKLSGWDGRITSKYGAYDSVRNGRMHTGVDVAGKKGTRLDSNVNGKVTSTGYNSISGNFVKILDDKGMSHFYGHLDKITAKLGDVVKVGDQIGNIGSTGNSTGPHLHYQQTNSKGQTINPIDSVNAAKGLTVSATQANSAVSNTRQSIDDAKSTLIGLTGDIENQKETIIQLEKAIINSFLAHFDNKKNVLDKDFALQNSRLSMTSKKDEKYNKILDYQLVILDKKKKYNQDEIGYMQELIRKGGLSEVVLDEINTKLVEAETSLRNINAEIQAFKLERITNEYDNAIGLAEDLISIEEARLELLNQNSPKYRESLESITENYKTQRDATSKLITSLQDLIVKEKLVGDAFEDANKQIAQAQSELLQLESAISKANYEIIINIKTKYDEADDDLQFEIDREKLFRDQYEEGSANYQNSLQKEIDLLKKQAQAKLELYYAKEKELSQLELTAEDYKLVTESMEDAELQYWSMMSAVKNLTKDMEDSRKKGLEKIADEAISALKGYYKERQDETNKAYDDELESARKKHEEIMKQYKDEMDLFRKNVEERLKLIDRTEAERSYDMEMDDLEKNRNEIVDKINLLSLDNSNEAKKKRKELQKQLDALDKEIKEKAHQRDLELQKQSLNDSLELKEEEIKGKEYLQDESYNKLVESINKQKEYWNQYYNDLLNDERKFNQLKEDIINGHLDKVMAEFEQYALELEGTMSNLENTLDGTMAGVGTAIRQNVIDNLREAIDMIHEFNDAQDSMSSGNQDSLIESDRNPNAGKPNLPNDGSSTKPPSNNKPPTEDKKPQLSDADYKVLMGKYFRERSVLIAKNQNTIDALKDKGNSLAKQGRDQGSIISPDETLNQAIGNLSAEHRNRFKSYVQSNAKNYLSGGYLLDDITKWAARLDTGGYMNWSGNGIDGKGGKAIIAHPNEIMLDKVDTKSLFESIKVTDSLMASLQSMTASFSSIFNSMSPSLSSTGMGEVNIQFGDVHNATKQEAQNFASEIINRLNVSKGVR